GVARVRGENVDHLLGDTEWHELVFGAVKGPDREMRDGRGALRLPASADGGDCREAMRLGDGEAPGAEAAHAQAGDVEAVRVDAAGLLDFVEQRAEQRWVPPLV